MAGKSKSDVELVIRAKNEAAKTLDEVVKSFEDLDGAVKKGKLDKVLEGFTTSTEDLTDRQKALKQVLADVAKAQANLGKALRDQNKEYEAAKSNVDRLSGKLKDLQASLEFGDKPTKYQKQLAASIEKTSQELSKANAELADARSRNKAASDSVKRLGAEYAKLELATSQAFDKLKGARKALSDHERATRSAEKAVAKLQTKLFDLGNTDVNVGDKLGQKKLAASINRTSDALGKAQDKLARLQSRYEHIAAPVAALEQEHKKLADSLSGVKTQLSGAEKEVSASGKAMSTLAKSIEKLTSDLKTSKAAMDQGPLSPAQQRRAQAAIEKTSVALSEAKATLARLDSEQKQAGVSSNILEKQQRELAAVSDKAAKELAQLNEQLDRNERAAKSAGKSLFGFGKNSRQALSISQRLRGEMLSLATSFLGVYSAIQGVDKSLETFQKFEAIKGRLNIVNEGDVKKTNEVLVQLRNTADALGLEFEGLADQYSRFAIAAKNSNFSLDETNFVFNKVSKAIRGARLSSENAQRVFYALEQMISKGTISMEELRQQMGDALPGAFSIFAKSLGKDQQEITKLITQGKVGSRALIPFAKSLEEAFSPGLSEAQKSLNAELGRFKNVLTDLKLQFTSGNFAEEFAKILRQLGTALKSPEAKDGIRALKDGFLAIGRAAVFAVQHLDSVISIVEILIGMKAASTLYAWAAGMQFFAAKTSIAATRLKFLRLSLLGVVGVLALYPVFEELRKQFQPFEEVLLRTVNLFKVFGVTAKAAFEQVVAVGKILFNGLIELITGSFNSALQAPFKVLLALIEQVRKIAPKSFQDTLGKMADAAKAFSSADFTFGLAPAFKRDRIAAQKELKKSRDTLSKEYESLANELDTVLNEAAKAREERLKKGSSAAPGAGLNTGNVSGDNVDWLITSQKSIKKFQGQFSTLITRLEDELAGLESKTSSTLQERLAAVDRTYDDVRKKILTLSKAVDSKGNRIISDAEIANADALVAKLVEVRQEMTKAKFIQQQFAEAQKAVNNLFAARSAEIELVNAKQKAGLITQGQAQQDINDITARYKDQLLGALDAAIKLAEAQGNPELISKLEAMRVGVEQVRKEYLVTAEQINTTFASSFTDAFEQFVKGTMSARDAFRSFAADFLSQIARMILQAAILRAIQGGALGTSIAGLFPTNHTGGIVGATASSKMVDPRVFAGAIRYHSGGIAGLAPNEVPTILQRGEEVLTKNDPRHRANGGAPGDGGVKIINAIDSSSMLQAALNTSDGKKAIINYIRANKASVRAALK